MQFCLTTASALMAPAGFPSEGWSAVFPPPHAARAIITAAANPRAALRQRDLIAGSPSFPKMDIRLNTSPKCQIQESDLIVKVVPYFAKSRQPYLFACLEWKRCRMMPQFWKMGHTVPGTFFEPKEDQLR
jgi:hypothetical protein